MPPGEVPEYRWSLKDHDLLVRIDERTESLYKRFDEQGARIESRVALAEQSTKKAHQRVDSVFRFRDKISGAVAIIGILCMVGTFILRASTP